MPSESFDDCRHPSDGCRSCAASQAKGKTRKRRSAKSIAHWILPRLSGSSGTRCLKNSVATWDQRWFPRVEDANGRHFLHELDDVKDHLPDRTADMTYLVYREKLLPFGEWVNAIAAARNQFAAAHQLPTRNYRLDWDDFSVASQELTIVQ